MYSDKQISAKMLLAAYQMCWALWYGTADEKLSMSHLCFDATIGAAICAEQSSANSQVDYMCHNVRHKALPALDHTKAWRFIRWEQGKVCFF